jgi:hypothetical protein
LEDSKKGALFQEHLHEATEKCNSGNPDAVMKVRFPLPMWISASAYLDKYGSGDKYDYVTLIQDIHVPVLWTFGQFEVESGSANFRNADSNLRSLLATRVHANKKHCVHVIDNADHSYRGVTADLADCIGRWALENAGIPQKPLA